MVTWFGSAAGLSRLVKKSEVALQGCGGRGERGDAPHPCALLYLSPVDYHCYHAPIGGALRQCELLRLERHSASVKPYIYEHINILAHNRRAVLVIESQSSPPVRCAMVIIGGVTVDSIRLEAGVAVGAAVAAGQMIGCFARGG